MDFEEKIDALRMNLELASHDIESLRASSEILRAASAAQNENVQVLAKATAGLLATAQSHERRTVGLERRA
jgi:hypothetical protein